MCYPTNLQNKNTYPVKQNSVSVDELRDLSFHMRSKCCSINDALEMLMKVASISDVRISIDVKFLIANPSIQLSSQETLLCHVIMSKTRFSDTSVCAPLNIIVMEVINAIGCCILDQSAYGMPGYSNLSSKISQLEVELYFARFSQIWVTKSLGSKLSSPIVIDDGNDVDDLVTIENFVDLVSDGHDTSNLLDESHPNGNLDEEFESDAFDAMDDAIPEEVHDVVDKVMNTYQDIIQESRCKSIYNANDIANIELYQMLQSAGAPAYLFDQIQDWASKHCSTILCQNGKKLERRKTFVKNMATKVYGDQFSSLMDPYIKKLQLPSGNKIDVVLHSFKAQMVSLLTDYDLMKSQNLLLNPNDLFGEVPDGMLSDVNTGWWFKETKNEMCTVPNRDLLLPLIFFLDASNLDKNGRLQVNPLTFTLGIFNRATRNKASAWRTMGYVDDLLNFDDKDVRKDQKASSKARDVHAIINLILQEMKSMQGKDGGFEWTLILNGQPRDVVFKLAVQVIIGDCKGNDLLCGRYGSHSIKVKRLCRDCDVLSLSGDDHNHMCWFLSRGDIENRTIEEMNNLSFHSINNAFSDVYFGA